MLDKARVLVVEDDAGIRMTLEDMLAAEGCVVESRPDGPSGEAAARSGGYDIILLDLMLPGRDGLAVCANLRGSGIRTPILMLTAQGDGPRRGHRAPAGGRRLRRQALRLGRPRREDGGAPSPRPGGGREGPQGGDPRVRPLRRVLPGPPQGRARARARPCRSTRRNTASSNSLPPTRAGSSGARRSWTWCGATIPRRLRGPSTSTWPSCAPASGSPSCLGTSSRYGAGATSSSSEAAPCERLAPWRAPPPLG